MVPAVETIYIYICRVKALAKGITWPVELILATHLVVNCCVGTASSCRHDHSCKRVTLCFSHDRQWFSKYIFLVSFACNAQ